MPLYFLYSQIPELAGLTPHRRKLVYQCALEALFAEQPSIMKVCALWVFGGILSGALAGWLAVNGFGLAHLAGWGKTLLVATACGLAGAIISNFMATHILHARLRPYIRRVLEERKDEIAQFN